MLILRRHAGESIQIGPDIKVKVTKITRGLVTLGIDAPAGLNISRPEMPPPPVKFQQAIFNVPGEVVPDAE